MKPFCVLHWRNFEEDCIYLAPFKDIYYGNDEIKTRYDYWRNDLELNKYSHGLFDSDEDRDVVWAVVWLKENYYYTHIGNVELTNINYINRSANLTCFLAYDEFKRKGIITWACEKIIEYGFNRLGLNRIYTGVALSNLAMHKVLRKLKFSEEGIFYEGAYYDGAFENQVAYGLLRRYWK